MSGHPEAPAGVTVRGALGLAYAATLIPLAYWGWGRVGAILAGTWLDDLRIVLGAAALFVLLWAAERLWTAIAARLPDER